MFEYNNMRNRGYVKDIQTGYGSIPRAGFYDFANMTAGLVNENSRVEAGWKFAISVNPQDVPAAWDAIYPILIAHRVYYSKVTRPDAPLVNRQITLYAFKDIIVPVEWNQILQEIETALVVANVRPAEAFPQANRIVPGSRFTSYRNDRGIDGAYIPQEDAGDNYNPGGYPDPYMIGFQIAPPPPAQVALGI